MTTKCHRFSLYSVKMSLFVTVELEDDRTYNYSDIQFLCRLMKLGIDERVLKIVSGKYMRKSYMIKSDQNRLSSFK